MTLQHGNYKTLIPTCSQKIRGVILTTRPSDLKICKCGRRHKEPNILC